MPHPVEHHGLPSGWHDASISVLWNSDRWRREFPSLSCPLDVQADLKPATLPANTGHRVNGISALQ